MAQIFPAGTNPVVRAVIVGIPPAACALIGVLYTLEWSPWATRMWVPISQPMPFVFHQASVLELYDPGRTRIVLRAGETSSWEEFPADLGPALAEQAAKGGSGLRLLAGSVSSPTLSAQILELRQPHNDRTPEGKVSRYFFGVNFEARDLQDALAVAGTRAISSPIARLVLVCFHHNPNTSHYGAIIINGLRAAGVLTLIVIFGGLAWLVRSERPQPFSPGSQNESAFTTPVL